ncbi:MAG: hypothetical protein ACOH2G_08425 [Ewingella sp.]
MSKGNIVTRARVAGNGFALWHACDKGNRVTGKRCCIDDGCIVY